MPLLGVCVVLVVLVSGLILVALYRGGDVKAMIKLCFLTFSLEAKAKREKTK
jgi:hypothetical protein